MTARRALAAKPAAVMAHDIIRAIAMLQQLGFTIEPPDSAEPPRRRRCKRNCHINQLAVREQRDDP
jgi:hypothetical protein